MTDIYIHLLLAVSRDLFQLCNKSIRQEVKNTVRNKRFFLCSRCGRSAKVHVCVKYFPLLNSVYREYSIHLWQILPAFVAGSSGVASGRAGRAEHDQR